MVRGLAITYNIGSGAQGPRGLRATLDSIWMPVGSDPFSLGLRYL